MPDAIRKINAVSARSARAPCGARSARAAVSRERVRQIAAKFGETGAEGEAAQRALVEVAQAAGMRLVGPNCIGSVGGPDRVMATFSPVFSAESTPVPSGSIALVSQSGALGYGALSLELDQRFEAMGLEIELLEQVEELTKRVRMYEVVKS